MRQCYENGVGAAGYLQKFSRSCGHLAVLGGVLVLLGWVCNNELLKRVIPGFVAMNPVTALGFIMAGMALWCFWLSERGGGVSKYGRVLASLIVLLGTVKLASYCLGLHLPFDQLLFGEQLHGDQRGVLNQIAPNTAFNFLIAGVVLWLIHSPVRHYSRWVQNLSLTLAFVSLVPLVGYIYQARYLYSIGSYIPMALHTAALFLVLAYGLLLTQSQAGVVALFSSPTPGGIIARRLLPFAFALPLILGALAIWGMKAQIYPSELGVTIVVVGSSAIFIGLSWRNARLLNRAHRLRSEAEETLKRAHDELEVRVQERTARLNEVNRKLSLQIATIQTAQEKIAEQAELLNQAQDAILMVDRAHKITFWNKGAERLYGWSAQDVLNRDVDEYLFNSTPELPGYDLSFEKGHWMGEMGQVTKSGKPITVESRWTLVQDRKGNAKGILIINTNITEKKCFEAQLLRSQRMESLGALAGGIAHDLNNALAPVILGTQLLRLHKDEHQREKLLNIISSSAERGTEMVKQILSFVRGSKGSAGPVQLSQVIKEMANLAEDTFPKSIAVKIHLASPLWNIAGDATELHQVLLNLCVNARDAMPQGGLLNLRAENITFDHENLPPEAEARPGPYVLLAVADTGAGIPPEILPRIFEPFFTTKAQGKGTGLGLSNVAAIIKNYRGFVQIQSELGKGTEFKVYLPAVNPAQPDEIKTENTSLPTGNGDLVLVMDDEEAIRTLAKTTLENYGYRVVTAANGRPGVSCFEEHKNDIRIVLSGADLSLMEGIMAIRAIQQIKPDVRIILIASGAKRDPEFPGQSIDPTHLTTLGKPYTRQQLLETVARAIQ